MNVHFQSQNQSYVWVSELRRGDACKMFGEDIVKTQNNAGQKHGVKFLKASFVPIMLNFAAKYDRRLNSVVNA